MKPEQFTSMLVTLLLAAGMFVIHYFYRKLYARIKDQAKEELIAEEIAGETIANFYEINADLTQHLKDDGIIQPQSGSEEHYQRWKAEREKREP